MKRMQHQKSVHTISKQDRRSAKNQDPSTSNIMNHPVHQRNSRFDLRALLRLPLRKAWRTIRDYRLLCSSHLMNAAWYWSTYEDVQIAGLDPVLHYLLHGAREGRNPGPLFDGIRYLQSNADVNAAGINPLVHYLRYGLAEGRFALPLGSATRRDPLSVSRLHADIGFINTERRLWFFIGDTLEWLKSHSQLTGVGRVTTELLLASLQHSGKLAAIPCVLDEGSADLVRAASSEQVRGLLDRVEVAGALRFDLPGRAVTVRGSESPCPGDHVLFTGVVWTPLFTDLFGRLRKRQVEFSVLLHDIIPLESPEMAGKASEQSFRQWLTVVLSNARTIFVSGSLMRDKLLRWATLAGVPVCADVVVLPFGVRNVGKALSADQLIADPQTNSIDVRRFVLSVGTIDARKNQLFLCRLWQRLTDTIGADNLPQLVLAGRDDLHLAAVAECSPLLHAGKVLVLQGLSDTQITSLYNDCLFTAFPSLSEGYGLPVVESLAHGKLCLSADLPAIREHARDLVWYFSTDDVQGALSLFAEAISNQEARVAAEQRIRDAFRSPTWSQCYSLLAAEAVEGVSLRDHDIGSAAPVAAFAGASEISTTDALNKSFQWCSSEKPDVSILIINWNSLSVTLECVRQIWAATDGQTYEIIIADNGSAPHEVRRLRKLGRGTRVLELGCNRFFGEANNIAAEQAQGRYLCLLNNDAFVRPGWLKALIGPLEENPAVGATGPMFLFPDGTVQEAGATVDPGGYPVRLGRLEHTPSVESLTSKFVDYISAAALVLSRELFVECGGFDLCYEPAYYEDTDLCFKVQALGRKVLYCPDARVTHIEGSAATDDSPAKTRKKHWGDLNRAKFVARWGDYLRTRQPETLIPVANRILPKCPSSFNSSAESEQPEQTAVVYTPYNLTPGGGESYLLTCATILAATYRVKLVTPNPYSRLRLANLGVEMGLDLSGIEPVAEAEFLKGYPPDLLFTMGNHVIPPIPGHGTTCIYLCQFPFSMDRERVQENRFLLDDYREILVYSEYVRAHLYAAQSSERLRQIPITVMPPPVQQIGGVASKTTNRILSVGRFFVGGHSKRQDALIEVFKSIIDQIPQPIELHLAGSSMPEPQHMDYLAQLFEMAQGYPVFFHINPSMESLHQLYRGATLYWHGTGIGADLAVTPEKAEHFGISIVEAMSAYAIPLALASGGPREIIEHGENGFLYDTPEELARLTISLLHPDTVEWRQHLSRAAAHKASEFSRERFGENFRLLFSKLVQQVPSPTTAIP